MDFEPSYTPEQEEFRKEVREWLKENVSPDITHPPDPIDITEEQYQLRRDLGRGLGSKGWLWPTAPVEYGGGGLDVDHAVVIEEEVDLRSDGASLLRLGRQAGRRIHPGMGHRGTEAGLPAADFPG